jgi:hypothetical protein
MSVEIQAVHEDAGWIVPNAGVYLPLAELAFRRTVYDHADTTHSPIQVNVFDLTDPFPEGPIFTSNGVDMLTGITIVMPRIHQFDRRVRRVERQIKSMRDDCYEIWPASHNVNDYGRGGFHLADNVGTATTLLNDITWAIRDSGFVVVDPPYDHNKISMKKKSDTALDGFHLDSFEGMRVDDNGSRRKIWRYFINLCYKPRPTVVIPLRPEASSVVPLVYHEDLLDPLFTILDDKILALRVVIPPRDSRTGRFFGFRMLTTHLLHAEYGQPDDTLAIVNTLAV